MLLQESSTCKVTVEKFSSQVTGQWSVVSGQWSVVTEQSPNLKVSLIVLRHIVVQAEQEGETKEKSKASEKEKD